jgi:hypothetical protein
LSISGDTKKSKDVFFSIFFGRLPGNRWLYHLTRHQTSHLKLERKPYQIAIWVL